MDKSVQYTMQRKQSITLTNLAKQWRLSRKLLVSLMQERGVLNKNILTSKEYGFNTRHVNRVSIYIYNQKIDLLFRVLKIPKMKEYQKLCYCCRDVRGIQAFKGNEATCMRCKEKIKKVKI